MVCQFPVMYMWSPLSLLSLHASRSKKHIQKGKRVPSEMIILCLSFPDSKGGGLSLRVLGVKTAEGLENLDIGLRPPHHLLPHIHYHYPIVY